MPELPEVETIVQDLLGQGIVNCTVKSIEIFWNKILAVPSLYEFCAALCGCQIVDIGRRGKYLLFYLSNNSLLIIHLRMTGRLLIKPEGSPPLLHEHLILSLDNGKAIHYHDTRKFGRWSLVADLNQALGFLGMEPLSNDYLFSSFSQKLKELHRQLKPLLLDQRFIAGLGNIYVDEALWEARIHPQTLSSSLTKKESKLLYDAIKTVLLRGLKTQGTTLGNGRNNYYRPDGSQGEHQHLLNVFRRTGLPCPRCGEKIIRIIVSQRGTHLCPNCQKK